MPNFFSSSPDAPEIIERLWDFAKAAYLDNPMPSLFKERLFVYLSRFCEVRYCIVRHCAFFVGRGHSSGDTSVVVQTVEHAIRLLKTPSPWARDLDVVLGGLEALPAIKEWPAPDTEAEDWLIAATTLVFVEPARSERPRNALRKVLAEIDLNICLDCSRLSALRTTGRSSTPNLLPILLQRALQKAEGLTEL